MLAPAASTGDAAAPGLAPCVIAAPGPEAVAPTLLRALAVGAEGEKVVSKASAALDLEAGDGPIPLEAGARLRAGSRSASTVQALAANAARLLRLSASSLDTETRDAVSFQDPTLLRGISASKVLQSRGTVLSSSCGSDSSYAMSKVVHQIDVFISHNWSTLREKKFRVLAFSFNLSAALLLNLVLGLAFMAMQACGLLPTLDMTSTKGVQYKSAPWNELVGTGFFFLILFKWHDLRNCLHIPGPTAFLDKTCIDQVDEDRKREGIESLAAFVRHSKSMLVIYSDTYLHKLWTVYELACFMTLHPRDRLTVVPVILADVLVMGINLFLLISIMDTVSSMTAVRTALGGAQSEVTGYVLKCALAIPCVVALCRIWRNWMHELSRINEQAADFSVLKAECFHEGDRPLVQHSIARFMRGIGLVQKDASEQAALEAFDQKVHLEVPRALQESVGRVGILYRHACVIFLPLALGNMDHVGVALNEGESALRIFLLVLFGTTQYLAVNPALLAFLSLAMRASLRLQRRVLVWASYAVTATVLILAALAWRNVAFSLQEWATDSSAGLGAALAISAAMFLLAALLYRGHR